MCVECNFTLTYKTVRTMEVTFCCGAENYFFGIKHFFIVLFFLWSLNSFFVLPVICCIFAEDLLPFFLDLMEIFCRTLEIWLRFAEVGTENFCLVFRFDGELRKFVYNFLKNVFDVKLLAQVRFVKFIFNAVEMNKILDFLL